MQREKNSYSFLYLTTSYISNKTAHGIQIINMSSAFFTELGASFELMSFGEKNHKLKFRNRIYDYKLPKILRTIFLFIIVFVYYKKKSSLIYTRDILLCSSLLFLGFNVCYECHSLPSNQIAKTCFKFSAKFKKFKSIYISSSLFQKIYDNYLCYLPKYRALVQHDGVNINDYLELDKTFYKEKYREELKLGGKFLLVHTGSLYKGGSQVFKDIIESIDNVFLFHVGGSTKEVKRLTEEIQVTGKNNFKLIPRLDQEMVRGIQISADLLIHINSKKSSIHWCTSPLKIFEYMATENPIIFAESQSVNEILNKDNAYPYFMDNSSQCLQSIKLAIDDILKNDTRKTDLAYQQVISNYTWEIRAQNIIKFLEKA